MKINIGAGSTRFDGYLNCDYSNMYDPDYIFDLEKDTWPFKDNSITHVIAHHVLEHLGEGYFHALKELYRVCANGASLDIRVPHHNSDNFYHDATHRRAITPSGLDMFSKKRNHRDFLANAATSRLGQYLDIDLELVSYSYLLSDKYKHLQNRSNQDIEDFAYEKNNIISESHIKMIVLKGDRRSNIDGYYVYFLNRHADADGLNYYLNSDLSLEQIREAILNSDECKSK